MDPDKGGLFFAAFTEGINGLDKDTLTTGIVTIISFCMIDMFDTMGTVVGCCSSANLMDEYGKPLNYSKIMYSDSIATCVGAVCGTSTVTTFVESSAGVAAGGRTGLSSLVTAFLFLLCLFILTSDRKEKKPEGLQNKQTEPSVGILVSSNKLTL